MKGQAVRLADVFLVGPFLVWAALRLSGPQWARSTLLVLGLLTIWYNGANYLEEARHGGQG